MVCTVELEKNGIAVFIMNYAEKLISRSIQIDIVAPNIVRSEDIRETIQRKGIGLYELPMRKANTGKYFWELVKIIKQGKYEIVHAHGNSCTLAIEMFAALLGGCKVRVAHSHNTTCQHKRAHRTLRPLFELTCTERLACGVEAGRWLFHKKKFEIAKNGIDIKKYRFQEEVRIRIRRELGIEKGEILLGHVGAFLYQKNQEFLIVLMKKMEECCPGRFRMILIGEGEEWNSTVEKIQRYGLQKSVILTGSRDNVNDYLQAMDCFLLPSRFEGLPFVLIEAQTAGLPCVVSNQISREADLTGNLYYLPIDEGETVWKKQLESMDYCRRSVGRLRDPEYDLEIAAGKLKRFYIESLRRKKVRRDF